MHDIPPHILHRSVDIDIIITYPCDGPKTSGLLGSACRFHAPYHKIRNIRKWTTIFPGYYSCTHVPSETPRSLLHKMHVIMLGVSALFAAVLLDGTVSSASLTPKRALRGGTHIGRRCTTTISSPSYVVAGRVSSPSLTISVL